MSAVSAPSRPEKRSIRLPDPRGPWTQRLFDALRDDPEAGSAALALRGVPGAIEPEDPSPPSLFPSPDPLADDDLQLALYVAYELCYSEIEGVDARWEWSPALIGFRTELERRFDEGLAELVPQSQLADILNVGETLQRLVDTDDGPPLSRFLETQATGSQMLEHVAHRSAYQLKEADPHSWAIPRMSGPVKAALLEIQFDEYGGGRAERMHSALFAKTMRGLGLDDSYGAYLALLPGITLATVNLISRFGLHRARRGALIGQLAVFEMTSSIPNRRYGNALRRLGHRPEVTDFYDEHVEADSVHESIAAWDLADGLAQAEPALAADILFGARALLALEARWAAHLLGAWRQQRSSLLAPLPGSDLG